MSEIPITYASRSDATRESEIAVLANIYAFLLQTHRARQKAAHTSRPKDAEEGRHHGLGAKPIIRE